MRVAIYSMLVDLSMCYKPCKIKGIYPPNVNLCKNQSDEELVKELTKMINFMKNPYYSYLSKDK
jgi:hypothetical protein